MGLDEHKAGHVLGHMTTETPMDHASVASCERGSLCLLRDQRPMWTVIHLLWLILGMAGRFLCGSKPTNLAEVVSQHLLPIVPLA